MNIYLELPDEEIDQAINDAEQMQASVKASNMRKSDFSDDQVG